MYTFIYLSISLYQNFMYICNTKYTVKNNLDGKLFGKIETF